MRVCLLMRPTVWGGMEAHTARLAAELMSRGHVVAGVFFEPAPECLRRFADAAAPYRVDVTSLPPLPRVGLRELGRHLRASGADVGVFPKGDLDAGSIRLDAVARATFRRYVTVEHLVAGPMPARTSGRHCGGLLPGAGLWWYRQLASRHLRWPWPHHVFCVSDAIRQRLSSGGFFPLSRTSTVHNGVDPARFVRRADWRAETRRRWGVPDDAVVLGSVARLARVKGHAVSIRALARAQPTSARPLRLVLVGDGPEGDALRALARDAGVADHVIFAGASSESWKAYSGIDLLLMPSIREGLPLALLEAMAAGCVPIATAVGGIPEVLTSAELGWLVPAGDAAAFEAAVRAAVACAPDELERRAVNARAHVVARFDERRQIAELANRLESLCGGAPCPAPSESAANNS